MECAEQVRETVGSSMPQKVLLKLRETRLSRHKQLRRAIPLWFVCVFEAARARRGRPVDALVEESEFPSLRYYTTAAAELDQARR